MSRTVAAPLASHIATRSHSRAWMLLFVLRDGTKFGITDCTRDIDFSLPEEPGTITYSANSGFKISNVVQAIGFDAGNYEVSGPIGDLVTLAGLIGGRWRNAETYLFQVNWKSPTSALDVMKGAVRDIKPSGGEFTFEIRDDRDRLNQVVGRVITNQCSGDHATCCLQIAPETETTIASVTDELTIEVADAITGADFIGGRLWFTSGELAGTDPIEIYAVTGSTITLFSELPGLPEVGDELTLKEGCDRSREQCRDRFDNVLEFRGFPEVPGSDQVLRAAVPGQGDQ